MEENRRAGAAGLMRSLSHDLQKICALMFRGDGLFV
jgi:hypothetical protein